MATDSASTVSTPRIDRKFVDAQGNLTQNAYALLYGLVRRTGGVVGEVIDIGGLTDQIEEVGTDVDAVEADLAALAKEVASIEDDSLLPPPPELIQREDDPAPSMEGMRARIHRLETLVNDLLIGYQA